MAQEEEDEAPGAEQLQAAIDRLNEEVGVLPPLSNLYLPTQARTSACKRQSYTHKHTNTCAIPLTHPRIRPRSVMEEEGG